MRTALVALTFGATGTGWAQPVEPPAANAVPEIVSVDTAAPSSDQAEMPVASSAPAAPPSVPMGTTVMIQLDAPVSSRSATRGDMFPISLADPIMIDGVEVIPAGITGEGQVVHAAGTGFGGRAGELIVAARYLMWGDRRIPLRGMRISTAGRNNTAEAIAVGQLIPFGGLFVTGTSVDLPIGQIAIARFAEAVPLAEAALLAGAAPAAQTLETITAVDATASPAAAPAGTVTEVQQGGTQ